MEAEDYDLMSTCHFRSLDPALIIVHGKRSAARVSTILRLFVRANTNNNGKFFCHWIQFNMKRFGRIQGRLCMAKKV